jgi:hypothetical protein
VGEEESKKLLTKSHRTRRQLGWDLKKHGKLVQLQSILLAMQLSQSLPEQCDIGLGSFQRCLLGRRQPATRFSLQGSLLLQ